MKTLAIITARGGSKRIPRKNIKLFSGTPIISYSIQAALKSEVFDEVMVSTDDREIAEISVSCGAKVPFLRSPATSNDYATTADVILEVIDEYRKIGMSFDYICCIYPTAPFITPSRLKEAMGKLKSSSADSLIPVVRFSYPIQRALKIESERLMMIHPENMYKRSQDLMPAYHDAGQFYCLKYDSFIKQKKLFADFTVPFVIPESEVQDIDNDEDWRIAEIKYRLLQEI